MEGRPCVIVIILKKSHEYPGRERYVKKLYQCLRLVLLHMIDTNLDKAKLPPKIEEVMCLVWRYDEDQLPSMAADRKAAGRQGHPSPGSCNCARGPTFTTLPGWYLVLVMFPGSGRWYTDTIHPESGEALSPLSWQTDTLFCINLDTLQHKISSYFHR